MKCISCKTVLTHWQKKYCSNKCQVDFQYITYIKRWKEGVVDGNRGISTRNISRYLRKYLIEKNGEKCSQCGWSKRHPQSNLILLEVDHIDGNAENNKEHNLRLLCPNCHAMTISYKNLNKGAGRTWRKQKYVKNTPH